nr:hypothetical protein CFP56_48699 [Quercus suber]
MEDRDEGGELVVLGREAEEATTAVSVAVVAVASPVSLSCGSCPRHHWVPLSQSRAARGWGGATIAPKRKREPKPSRKEVSILAKLWKFSKTLPSPFCPDVIGTWMRAKIQSTSPLLLLLFLLFVSLLFVSLLFSSCLTRGRRPSPNDPISTATSLSLTSDARYGSLHDRPESLPRRGHRVAHTSDHARRHLTRPVDSAVSLRRK